ncbi:MAG: tyrosine-type recombinase/integrase [Planctomycetota bacterium]
MASIRKDPSSGRFRIRFRLQGQEFNRSIKTKDKKEATAILGRVEETIMLVERGRLTIPEEAELGKFVLSDGKITRPASAPQIKNIKELFIKYEKSQFHTAKEEATQKTEQTHLRHMRRLLKLSTPLQSTRVSAIQAYVDKRLLEKRNGKPLLPDTVKNEVVTFRLIWNWAVNQELINMRSPTRGVVFPHRSEKPPFMTRKEIEQKISRGGLSDDQLDELWESLYLSGNEINEILIVAKQNIRCPFIYPLLVTAAFTGARRSELLRSQIDDFNFENNTVHFREKKKSRSKSVTFRSVPMSETLRDTIKVWLENHPGGQMTFVHQDCRPITVNSASHHFEHTFKKSNWNVLRGFHVFRHSFCSNCASAGIDQRLINEWVGHQTEEMVKRYRHLFPEKQQQAINKVFG